MDLLNSFVAGWVGGIGNLLVGHPFDTVKTLMQHNSGRYKNSAHCVRTLIREEGPFALYKGVLAPMTGVGVVFALYFLAYDATEKFIRYIKGLDSTKRLPMIDVMICGGSTGVLGSLVLGPAELLKVRQQTAVANGLDGSFKAVYRHIYKNDGIFGYFRGTSATMMRDVPGSMAWFGAYEFTKNAICEDPSKPTVYQALLAGGMGGLGMWSFAIPLDTIKTYVQANTSAKISPLGAAKRIFKANGIKGFYRGIGPALLRAFPANAATFACKETAQGTLNKLTASN